MATKVIKDSWGDKGEIWDSCGSVFIDIQETWLGRPRGMAGLAMSPSKARKLARMLKKAAKRAERQS